MTTNNKGRARLPALPPVSAQDSSVKAWMQAVAEHLEVREGQRNNPGERTVTRNELAEFMAQGTTTTPGSVESTQWWAKFKDINALGDALRQTTMHDDLLRRIARLGGESDHVSTVESGDSAGSNPTTTGSPPDALRLTRNDLDFYRLPSVSSRVDSVLQEFVCTVNTSEFYALGGNHIVFAMDCSGGAGTGQPHNGPVVRNGANLFVLARGCIIFADGQVWFEHWNGTTNPGVTRITSTIEGFSPATTPIFTVRLSAGYRSGAMANYMAVNIHAGGPTGPLVFSGSQPWGWNWTGTHVAYFAAIGTRFITPNDTGNVETQAPGVAPNATVHFSGARLLVT